MRLIMAAGVIGAGVLAASPAFAVTVTNQDSKSHTIVVKDGKSDTTKDLAAGASAEFPCPDKCGFRDLAYGTSRLAGGQAKLVIDKDGEVHMAGGHGDFELSNGTN